MKNLKSNSHSNPTQDQRWLSVGDFTLQFGISKATQQRLRSLKKLPYSKIGNIIRYDRFKIDEFFSDHTIA